MEIHVSTICSLRVSTFTALELKSEEDNLGTSCTRIIPGLLLLHVGYMCSFNLKLLTNNFKGVYELSFQFTKAMYMYIMHAHSCVIQNTCSLKDWRASVGKILSLQTQDYLQTLYLVYE